MNITEVSKLVAERDTRGGIGYNMVAPSYRFESCSLY
jgi:hypothetical protein